MDFQWNNLFGFMYWFLWKQCNEVIFQEKFMQSDMFISIVISWANAYIRVVKEVCPAAHETTKKVEWSKPPSC